MADVGEPEPEEKPLDPAQERKDREKEGKFSRGKWDPADLLSPIPSTQTTERLLVPRSGSTGR